MKSNVAVITGANSGIGYQTALALARQGFEVALVSRTIDKSETAREAILAEVPGAKLRTFAAELASARQVDHVVRQLRETYPAIDVLINNAGTWFAKRTLTEDGFETEWAVNYLAAVRLTFGLLPALLAAPAARILNVASDSHLNGKIFWDDVSLDGRYNGLRAYRQSKLAMVLFSHELAQRLNEAQTGISVHAIQPGLVQTNMGNKNTNWLFSLIWNIRKSAGTTEAEGAATTVYLATSDEVRNLTGGYWDKSKQKPSHPLSYDPAARQRLWELTRQQTGLSLEIRKAP
jgi:NAD(P)-dependent dehydrogenase (short-subunit alcohol dehydrogenase family)